MALCISDRPETRTQSPLRQSTTVARPTSRMRLSEEQCLALFHRMKRSTPESARQIRTLLIEGHVPVVHHLARKFMERGEPLEDLVQAGTLGLIGAVDRFDPDRGIKFITFATYTIVGEIKRYFRDSSWAMKVPRRLKELNASLEKARAQATRRLGRVPTLRELAVELDASEEETIAAMELGTIRNLLSLDAPVDMPDAGGATCTRAECLGAEDPEIVRITRWSHVHEALHLLDPREREIVQLRYFDGLTQMETAEAMGISQMHVSRLQRRALDKLRTAIAAEAD